MAKGTKQVTPDEYDAVVIGSGFGGSVAATIFAESGKSVLILERGTFWGNPEGPAHKWPPSSPSPSPTVYRQYWPRPNNHKGLVYVAHSIYKERPLRASTNDLGLRVNPNGLYRITRFEDDNGNVDIVSGSGVGGGSLFYSGVNLKPESEILQRLGLEGLEGVGGGDDYFQKALRWMRTFRGRINKIVTKVPVPHRQGTHIQLPSDGQVPDYEMPDPDLPSQRRYEEDYLLIDRSRVLKWAHEDATGDDDYDKIDANMPAKVGDWQPLPLSVVEYDPLEQKEQRTVLTNGIDPNDTDVTVDDAIRLPTASSLDANTHFQISIDSEIMTVTNVSGNVLTVDRGVHATTAADHAQYADVSFVFPTDSDNKNAFCIRQGRCMLGCMPSARHTLYKTLEKLRDKTGVDLEIKSESEVDQIEQMADGSYLIHGTRRLRDVDGNAILDEDGNETTQVFSAKATTVFLAGGVLGSTEIILKSQENGLPVNNFVGHKFSTNGDFFAFALDPQLNQDTKRPRYGRPNPTDGPINASGFHISFEETGSESDTRIDVHVEDCGIPATFAELIKNLLPNIRSRPKLAAHLVEVAASLTLNRGPYSERNRPDTTDKKDSHETEQAMIQNVYLFHAMGACPKDKEPLGTFTLKNRKLKLRFNDKPLDRTNPIFQKVTAVCQKLADQMNATFEHSPFLALKDEDRFTVVHPLGGIPIGSDSDESAANEFGQLFKDTGEPLAGLYVVDASAIPGSLAVNPTLTIVAQAIKAVEHALDNS